MCEKKSRFVKTMPLLAALSLALAACSDVPQEDFGGEDALTLRARAREMADAVPWTDAAADGRLTAALPAAEGIDRRVALVPLSFLAGSEARTMPPLYPFLEGFGSLDTTLIAGGVRETLDGFCDALCHAGDADPFMARGCLYQLAFLYHDAGLGEPSEGTAVFDSFFYGQPYVTGGTYEVPVRFEGGARALDLLVFLLEEDGGWKIDELRILRGEGGDGARADGN